MSDLSDSEENPFTYRPGEEPPPVVHELLGSCHYCGDDGFVMDGWKHISCFPCAYHNAN